MQVLPHFASYKILEQYPILKDDTGNEFCLTLFEVMPNSDDTTIVVNPYQLWIVVSSRKDVFSNKAVAYNGTAVWKTKEKDSLFKEIINGFLIEEYEYGYHGMFSGGIFCHPKKFGLSTRFKITRV